MKRPLDFVREMTGREISADDWHHLRKATEIELGGTLSRTRAYPGDVSDAVSLLATSIASSEHIGDTLREEYDIIPSWGYSDEDDLEFMDTRARILDTYTRNLLDSMKKIRVTNGTVETLNNISRYGVDYAVKRARSIVANPYEETTTPPPELQDLAVEITQQADHVYFESANWMHEEGDEVALADMRVPHLAGNNCYNSADAVASILDDDGLVPEGWKHSRVEAMYLDDSPGQKGSGVHWANMLTSPDGERWIMDYTARQFGGDVPYPLITHYDQWLGHVTARTKDIWGSDLSTVWNHEGYGGEVDVLYLADSAHAAAS